MDKLNLNSEEICGYLVTEEMKKVWKVELDIVEKVLEICKKYDINYYTYAGTLLGCVRHKGYIPWDDDIDIVMLRKDYDKFMDVAIKELKEPYFVQCYKTEKKYYRGHIQIRNSNTTVIIDGDQYNDYNKGIFVDIFPLDNVPDDEKEKEKFIKKINKKKKIISFSLLNYSPNLIKKIIKFFYKNIYWKILDVDKEIEKLEKFVKKYNNIETKYSRNSGGYFIFENDWFKDKIDMNFEYLKLSCVKKYDELLKAEFGDNYMEIPKIKYKSTHGTAYFNTEKSYKEFSKEEILEIVKKIQNNEI